MYACCFADVPRGAALIDYALPVSAGTRGKRPRSQVTSSSTPPAIPKRKQELRPLSADKLAQERAYPDHLTAWCSEEHDGRLAGKLSIVPRCASRFLSDAALTSRALQRACWRSLHCEELTC